MERSTLRRTGALLLSAALLASLTVATVASPASAAKPKCQGQTATIVGTAKGEVIRGTARRDVIVAKGGPDRIYGKGGNDLICAGTGNDLVVGGPGADTVWGQLGNDRLLGGPGPDFLAGQVGNDTIDGGLQIDKCYQGTGTGAVTNCELPVPPVAAPPPSEPPTLAIAYTDVNRNHAYDAGDVMIAKVIDANGTGKVDPGDTVKMGQYPTTPYAVTPAAVRQTFEDWRVREHPVTSADLLPANFDILQINAGAPNRYFSWEKIGATENADVFYETDGSADRASGISDEGDPGLWFDFISYEFNSPSQPMSKLQLQGDSTGDDGFIDVEIYAP